MRLIDADKFGTYLADLQLANRGWRNEVCDWLDDLMEALDEQPSIDAVPAKNIDYMAKINLWLMQRYRDDLFKEFGIQSNDIGAIMKMLDKIYEEQCKEMPLPWYRYGLGLKETET